ncbi:MAG: Na+/H+ antiporter subunit E [Acidimicrobiia bacterium]
MTRVVRMALLVVLWLVFWSDVSLTNVVSGVAVAAAVTVAFNTWRPGRVVVRPVAAARFGLYFLGQLLMSTFDVARAVVSPRHRIRTGVVAVPLQGCSDAVAALIADAITLTPGTLTLEVRREPLTLFVHALEVRDVEDVRRSIRKLEVLAVKAFGDADAIAGLAVDDTRHWRAR